MNRLALASFGSGLLGAMFGATLVVWLAHDEAPAVGQAAPVGERSADLERRLAAVERTLAAVEPRVGVLPMAVAAAADDRPTGSEASAARDGTAPVDSPVFEAAVLDIIEREKEGRDSQRSVARDEKRRQREQYWANEVTMRLGLTPAQTERLLAIQAQLASELERERERQATPEGELVPREKRRADRQAIRRRAEDQLRAVLAPRQLAAYEQLDDKLKLYRAKDVD